MSELRTIEKGALLQRQGTKVQWVFKVHSGLIRSFFVDELGKEHVFMFAPENWVVADLEAVGFDAPCTLNIEALEPSMIEFIPIVNIAQSMGGMHGGAQEFNRLIRNTGTLQRRVLLLLSSNALERYEYFLKTYPDLSPRLTQKLIASYLGVTPQRLSAIRAERVGKSSARYESM